MIPLPIIAWHVHVAVNLLVFHQLLEVGLKIILSYIPLKPDGVQLRCPVFHEGGFLLVVSKPLSVNPLAKFVVCLGHIRPRDAKTTVGLVVRHQVLIVIPPHAEFSARPAETNGVQAFDVLLGELPGGHVQPHFELLYAKGSGFVHTYRKIFRTDDVASIDRHYAIPGFDFVYKRTCLVHMCDLRSLDLFRELYRKTKSPRRHLH
mmetsp:Transcript_22347/g.47080  ORF Transcript_22347/g.47080 Transcript_22347/m.47080 type:complete len:205 (-) Transcript_22347:1358-1972(-)